MPQEPKEDETFGELTKLIHWIHERWVIFNELVCQNEMRVAHLNRRTGFVFYHFITALEDSILLAIAKAIDKDSKALSLRRAITHLPGAPDGSPKADRQRVAASKQSLLDKLEQVRKVCEPILDHRDKRIAHHEAKVVIGETSLPHVSPKKMEEAINAVASLISDISVERDGQGMGFWGAEIDMEPACRMLLYVLRAGNHFLDEKDREKGDLMDRLGRGDVVEDYEAQLRDKIRWFRDDD